MPAAASGLQPTRKKNVGEPRIIWGEATKEFFWGKGQHGVEDVANEEGFPLKVIRGLLKVPPLPLSRLPSVPNTLAPPRRGKRCVERVRWLPRPT